MQGLTSVEIGFVRGLAATRQLLQRRLFKAYCVGAARSGTRSLAGIFERKYRARHEPRLAPLIRLIDEFADPEASRAADRSLAATALREAVERVRHDQDCLDRARRVLAWRDLQIWLEFESSFAASLVLEVLVDLFEDSRFVLTLRHPRDWLESMFNRQPLLESMPPSHRRWADMWFGLDRFAHPPAESVLAKNGLYTLDGYLTFWRDHNVRVLETVPAERLLVLRTDRIGQSCDDLARFLEISTENLDASRGSLNQTRVQLGLMARLDTDYVDAKIEEHCGSLLARYFPKNGRSAVVD